MGNTTVASFSPNRKLVASGDLDGGVRLWTINDREANLFAVSPLVHRSDDNDDEAPVDEDDDEGVVTTWVNSVAFSPNGQNLASGGEEGHIFLWDTRKFL